MSVKLIFDGGMGTSLQDLQRDSEDPRQSCNEYLNRIYPEAILSAHRSFLRAGSNVIETNTFGANPTVLCEYGLEDLTEELNRLGVRLARQAAADFPGAKVAASIGPGSKLPSLGHISVDEAAVAYRRQVSALFEASPDFLLIETCQDLLQIKVILSVIGECEERFGRQIPVMVSVTVEENGTLLTGSSVSAVIATLEPYKLFSLGLNCATGPDKMEASLRVLADESPFPISCMPNQGLPEIRNGKAFYPLAPADFASRMTDLAHRYNIAVVGGCCGTRAEHIAALSATLREKGEVQP